MAETMPYAVAFLPSGRPDYIASERMGFERYLALEYEHGLAEWVNGEVRPRASTLSASVTTRAGRPPCW
jgi:hypothetical protein